MPFLPPNQQRQSTEGRSGLLLAVRVYSAAVGVLNISGHRRGNMLYAQSDSRQWFSTGLLSTIASLSNYYAPDTGARSIVMSVSVCVPLCMYVVICPRSYLRNYTSDLHQFFVNVTYGRGSVLL